ncbi:MAG: hypothetical protein HQL93_09695 [Magnetococcales bacterium]|nr:hypothetical protein [Magnetococcales bacterium]
MIFKNKKTSKKYVIVDYHAIDATNIREGTPVVIYRAIGSRQPVFVRDKDEFHEKFEILSERESEMLDFAERSNKNGETPQDGLA